MPHNLEESVALLERTPNVLNASMRGLPEIWTMRHEGDGTWTAFDVVAHLIHTEHNNWIPRTRCVLDHGESQAFPPFNREGNFTESRQKTLAELLDDFSRARAESLQALGALNPQPQDLKKKGKHPALGAVTLSELLATWVAHDLTHLHQISRIMAFQYRDSVGPFNKFLGVLHCAGHGA